MQGYFLCVPQENNGVLPQESFSFLLLNHYIFSTKLYKSCLKQENQQKYFSLSVLQGYRYKTIIKSKILHIKKITVFAMPII